MIKLILRISILDCLETERSVSPSSKVARGGARATIALRQTCFTLGPDWISVVEPPSPLLLLFSLVLEPGQCSAEKKQRVANYAHLSFFFKC